MKEIVKSVRAMEEKHKRGVNGNSNDLLMNMSHEFKTPLSAIQLNAQLLEKVVENKSGYMLKFLSKYIERILDQSKNVVNILEDTMTYMRMQNEKPAMDFSISDGADLYKEITSVYENYYPNRVLDIENNANATVMVDRGTFFKAIVKLVRIALEAMPDDRPRMTMNDSPKHMSVQLVAPNLRIKPSEVKTIFEPFSSLSEFNQVEALPLRLGLIKELLSLNGAKIKIELGENHETVFTVCVPKYEHKPVVS